MMFSTKSSLNIARRLLRLSKNPLYVQYYITARCNLTCKQCNIIYANANVAEASLEQVQQIAENLAQIGTAIVLLTGGEPFLRKDLPEIIKAFSSRGIHVRTQTNGFATEKQLLAAKDAGARDISISLDSLSASKQEFLNGSHAKSWGRALETISLVSKCYPKQKSFAAFGTVLSPQNILEIPNIIRFATEIGWYVSLVPAHITSPTEVFNFRSYDREMIFPSELLPLVDQILNECLKLKKAGYLLYDSEEYLRNIRRFIRGENLDWRRRNSGHCDSPDLYFAIRPNGDFQTCCDHILRESFPVWHKDFPTWFSDGTIKSAAKPITRRCSGCMYGSYPEVSISYHYPLTMLERLGVFWKTRIKKPWPLSEEQLYSIIDKISNEHPVDDSRVTKFLENIPAQAEATQLVQIGGKGVC